MNALLKNSACLLSANVIAQAIGLVVYPILTRFYSPADFGLLNLFLSISSVLIIFSTAEYQNAIVLPKNDEQAKNIFQWGILLILIFSGVLLLSCCFSSSIAACFHTPDLQPWWKWLCLFVAGSGIWNLLNNWLIRKRDFRAIGVYQVSQSLIGAAVKIVFGLLGFLHGGLIVASIVALLAALLLCCFVWKSSIRSLFVGSPVNWRQMKAEAIIYKNFPYYSLPRSLMNSVSGNLPAFVLSPVFGLTELGYFSMATTLALRPIQMITQSFYQVLYQQVTAAVNAGQTVLQLVRQYIRWSIVIVIPCLAILWWILPVLTSWLLGDEWLPTAYYIRIMLPWLAMVVISPALGFIPDIFMQQRKATIIEVVYLVLRIFALSVGVWMHSFKIAVVAYSVVGVVILTYQLCWYIYLLHHYEQNITMP